MVSCWVIALVLLISGLNHSTWPCALGCSGVIYLCGIPAVCAANSVKACMSNSGPLLLWSVFRTLSAAKNFLSLFSVVSDKVDEMNSTSGYLRYWCYNKCILAL